MRRYPSEVVEAKANGDPPSVKPVMLYVDETYTEPEKRYTRSATPEQPPQGELLSSMSVRDIEESSTGTSDDGYLVATL